MPDHQSISESLTRSLLLKQTPLAVCLSNDVPEGVEANAQQVPAGCSFWGAMTTGPLATTAKDHELCAIGVHTHNLAEPSASHGDELGNVLQVMAGLEYVRQEDVEQIPVLERSVRHVIYAPLPQAPLPPDVVLLFADAAQGLTITEAVQQVESGMPPTMGRPACAVVPQAVNSGRAAVSLGCCGARAYLDGMSEGVALWALPGARLAEYAARIEKLAHANQLLGRFHEIRRKDVEAGGRPTYQESLSRMES
jgi:uncharacterized protein (DUF169 family)